MTITEKANDFTVPLSEVSMKDIARVGGKNASLGEMLQSLPQSIRVPNGFAVIADAYRHFIAANNLEPKLRAALQDLNEKDIAALSRAGAECRRIIMAGRLPDDLIDAIVGAYRVLCREYAPNTDVAVRSSATAEDLPTASFAETFLNVCGEIELLGACHKCYASLFTDRAISYRVNNGFDHFSVALSIGVQKMVRSDLASSGVLFTLDTESGFPDIVLVTSAYGLGENVVQGTVNPDEFMVFKPTLKQNKRPIIERRCGSKELRMVYDMTGSKMVKNQAVPAAQRARFSLTDDEVLELARWGCLIEQHYSRLHDKWTPMDVEWAKDGHSGQLFVVQARPETVKSRSDQNILRRYVMTRTGNESVLARGRAVGQRIATGVARVITRISDAALLQPGEVLVTHRTDPDWEPVMKRAAAIVTDEGGRTCHAAILARELAVPAVIGTENGTDRIRSGDLATVSCAEGDTGTIYAGECAFEVLETRLDKLPKTRTKILINLGNPNEALSHSRLPVQGVGLARLEFIIAEHCRVHPLALTRFDKLKNETTRETIRQLTAGYSRREDFFVDHLASGIAMIGAAFYPRQVIVRMSDFKTNEYANLIGGDEFEPKEENPMLGWRGASRYYDENYRDGFALECAAFVKVREEMGLVNVMPMIPFCRTVAEARHVVAEMARNGLKKSEALRIYCMCEVPSNIILAREFLEIFDGYSIGSNDLTQLLLGIDRDSAIVSRLFDERDPAVKEMITQVIATAHRNDKPVGICGQAPSDYPDFAEFLLRSGIDSMSLAPDSVLETLLLVNEVESNMRLGR